MHTASENAQQPLLVDIVSWILCVITPFWPYSCMNGFTYSPSFKLCRFRSGGLDQRDDNWGFNHFLLRLLGTREAKCRHWINAISDLNKKERQQNKMWTMLQPGFTERRWKTEEPSTLWKHPTVIWANTALLWSFQMRWSLEFLSSYLTSSRNLSSSKAGNCESLKNIQAHW